MDIAELDERQAAFIAAMRVKYGLSEPPEDTEARRERLASRRAERRLARRIARYVR